MEQKVTKLVGNREPLPDWAVRRVDANRYAVGVSDQKTRHVFKVAVPEFDAAFRDHVLDGDGHRRGALSEQAFHYPLYL